MAKKYYRRGFQKREKPFYDLGTPELRLKRIASLGPQRVKWPPPDQNAAESALGVFLWQGYLHSEYEQAKRMHDAGVTFASWWTLVHPKSHAQGTLGQFQPKGATEDVDTEEAEACLRAASAFLKKDNRVLHKVIDVCVYHNFEHRHLDKLRTGLCRLIEWFRSPEAEAIRERHEKDVAA
jgi:hypothetical protein